MAITSGVGTTVSIETSIGGATDVTADILSISFGNDRTQWDITNLSQSAVARMALIQDAKISIKAASNPAGINLVCRDGHDVAREVILVFPGPETMTATMNITSYTAGVQNGENTRDIELSCSDGVGPVWT
jgi:hypothetical protein